MSNRTIQPKRDMAHQAGTASNETEKAFNDNAPSKPGTDRRFRSGLSWAWIALSGMATCLWLIGVGWIAVKFFRWLVY
jgi:hypothetical protein